MAVNVVINDNATKKWKLAFHLGKIRVGIIVINCWNYLSILNLFPVK